MKKTSILFTISIVMLLAACQPKPLKITLPESEKKIAISSVVVPGNVLAVSVSYSFSALKNNEDSTGANTYDSTLYNQFLVEHALVTIQYNNKTDTLYKLLPGIYGSAGILNISNTTYTLNVHDSSTDLRVSAQSTMLPRVDFDTLYFTKTKNPGDTLLQVHFSIADNLNTEDYYMVSYYNAAASPIYKALFNNPEKSKFVNVELYSDKITDANARIRVDKNFFLPDNNDTLIVEMAHISKGYYEFLTAYKKSDRLVFQLLGEPVTLPTNVLGGYGYFSTFNPVFRFVDLSRL